MTKMRRPTPKSTGAPRKRRGKAAASRGATTRRPTRKQPAVVTIRALISGELLEAIVSRQAPFRRLSEEWTYVLRARTRWADDPDLRIDIRERALEGLERAGVSREFMRR